MRQNTLTPVAQSDVLGASTWLIILKPERGRDEINVYLMEAEGRRACPSFGVMIHASSTFNIPALTAKALVELNEKESEYRQKAMKVIS